MSSKFIVFEIITNAPLLKNCTLREKAIGLGLHIRLIGFQLVVCVRFGFSVLSVLLLQTKRIVS